ncbi:adenylate/guanylate cyclase domain-containing protein [Calothrix sp. PCC 6303]|uniref:adenylate/guanylate cyclase domain-containing protein n=1 Tax=Calothrix sp. PCC 6303 TaxID=1170562 RepID=UPI0002A0212E|nr:adenylate/guanylate cyclase domain-containing protein [Calothrix sp. PCC 6303]AFZ03637.1 adenylate/guanylate cyclase [Calothrix sp. PCC 6303]
MSKKLPHSSPIRNLTIFYTASLSAVAFLSIMGQLVVQRMLTQQQQNLEIVSLIEKRQTLCQQMIKHTMRMKLEPSRENRQELQQLIMAWKDSGEALNQAAENVEDFSQTQQRVLQQKISTIEPAGVEMREAASQMMQEGIREKRLGFSEPPIDVIKQSPIARLLKEEQTLMKGLDDISQWYNQEVIAGITQLKQMEYGLLGLMLFVLLLEGILVFRPAVMKIQDTLSQLKIALHESKVASQKLAIEKSQSEQLLLNILPQPIAQRLKQSQATSNINADILIADAFNDTTVMFADIVGFTDLSSRIPPQELVNLLNQIFSRFDLLAESYNLEKIKTIGDAYMVVGGLPSPRADHAIAIASMALEMIDAIAQFNLDTGENFQIRIGINSGSVVAGVIGLRKFIYDLWGDTVNIASRMESHGAPGLVHVTKDTYILLKNVFILEKRGLISVKGKGEMETYWLKGKINPA